MSSKKAPKARNVKRFNSDALPALNRPRPAQGPPQGPPPAAPAARTPQAHAAGARAYVWVEGVRLSYPAASLPSADREAAALDDAWTLYHAWLQDYLWWSGGVTPLAPQDSFRKAVASCHARILRKRGLTSRAIIRSPNVRVGCPHAPCAYACGFVGALTRFRRPAPGRPRFSLGK